MKLYVWGPAPNPRRVRIFLAEKGIAVPTEDVGAGAMLKPEFLQKSPHRLTPMLELDDGTLIGEAMAICRYFETQHPDPPLFGRSAEQTALIEMWERKAEQEGLQAVGEVFRNSIPAFADRGLGGFDVPVPQIPALVERGKLRTAVFFQKLDAQLAKHRYVADDEFSVADITALCAHDFAKRVGLVPTEEQRHVARWYAEISARPSVKA